MKRMTKVAVCALLSLLILLCAVPAFAESNETAQGYYETLALDMESEDSVLAPNASASSLVAERVAYEDGSGHYFLITSKDEDVNAPGAYFQAPTTTLKWTGAADTDYTRFTVDMTLLENEAPMSQRIRLWLTTNNNGSTGGGRTQFDLGQINLNGDVKIYDFKIGNVKEQTLNISVVHTYSENAKAFYADVYCNGELVLNDIQKTTLAGSYTAETVVNNTAHGITALQFYTNDIYSDCAKDETVPGTTYKTTIGNAYDPETGDMLYSLKFDNLYFTTGSATPKLAINAAATKRIEPLSGASIRVGSDASTSGIRFSYALDRAWYDSLVESGKTVKVGALIVPEDYLDTLAQLTHAALGSETKHIDLTATTFDPVESSEELYVYHASIVKILGENYARRFVSVGYIKVGNMFYYSPLGDSRSVVEVARNYTASGDVLDSHKACVKSYIDSVVFLNEETLSLVESTGYTSPYSVTFGGDKLALALKEGSAGSLDSIKSIVIGDSVYTGGWSTESGSLVAPLPLVDIIYETAGGTIVGDYQVACTDKFGLATLPSDVTLAGKIFIGWYADADYTNAVTSIPAGTTEDVTLYARYLTIAYDFRYDGNDSTNMPVSGSDSTVELNDGIGLWTIVKGKNPSMYLNDATKNPIVEKENSITFTIDLGIVDGKTPIDFYIRLLMETRNVSTVNFITVKAGKVYIGNSAKDQYLLCDLNANPGMHRFTIVMTNDNAGLAAGKASNASSTPDANTTADAYKSTITSYGYVDGVYKASASQSTFMTFGDSFTYHNSNATGSNAYQSVSDTSVNRLQLVPTKNDNADCSFYIDNLAVIDGALYTKHE